MKRGAATSTLLAGVALSIAASLYASSLHLNHDVAGYLALAERILDGAQLYVDTLLPTQLSIVCLNALPVMLSEWTPLSLPDAFYIFLFVLLQACVFLCWRVLRDAPRVGEPLPLAAIVAVLYGALFLLPLRDNNFGQREQLICAMFAPYFLLCLRRTLGGTPVPLPISIVSGVVAAFGVSIKPQYLLLVAACELWLLWSGRSMRSWVRAETLSLFAASAVYLGLWVALHPEAFRLVPHFAEAYSAYGNPTSQKLATLARLGVVALPLAILMVRPGTGSPGRSIEFDALGLGLVAIAVNMAIFFLQSGFFYQRFSILFFEFLLAAYAVALFPRRWIPVGVCALMALLLVNDLREAIPRNAEHRNRLAVPLESIGPSLEDQRVMVLSMSMFPWYPVIVHSGASWAGPLWFLKYLPAAYVDDRGSGREPLYHALDAMSDTERFYHEAIIRELTDAPPDVVIVSTGKVHQSMTAMKFDILASFSADPRFRELWREYRIAVKGARYAIFLRMADRLRVGLPEREIGVSGE